MIEPIVAATLGALAGIGLFAAWRGLRIVGARRKGGVAVERGRDEARQHEARAVVTLDRVRTRQQRHVAEEESRLRERLPDLTERLVRREGEVDRLYEYLDERERGLDGSRSLLGEVRKEAEQAGEEITGIRARLRSDLLARTGLDEGQAVEGFLKDLEGRVRHEEELRHERFLRQIETDAEEEAVRILDRILVRVPSEHSEDPPGATLTIEEYGRLGGHLERFPEIAARIEEATGVRLEAKREEGTLHLSASLGITREIVRRLLRRLGKLPKVRPDRIPDMLREIGGRVEQEATAAARKAAKRLRLRRLPKGVVETMGRMRFQTSHRQNLLDHSYEVGRIGGMLAAEMGLDPVLGRRVSWLHDVGKVIRDDLGTGTAGHAAVGGEFLRREGEDEITVNAVAAHHEETDKISLYPIVAQVADAVSGARPGARRDTSDLYLERVEKLDSIARGHTGVQQVFVMHGGRELRVAVDPGKVSDAEATALCETLVGEVVDRVAGPGCDVMVVRETKYSYRVRRKGKGGRSH